VIFYKRDIISAKYGGIFDIVVSKQTKIIF